MVAPVVGQETGLAVALAGMRADLFDPKPETRNPKPYSWPRWQRS